VQLAANTLTDEDRRLLGELARRMEEHLPRITADWTDAILQALTPSSIEPEAYRQVIAYFGEVSLRAYVDHVGSGDFEAMYDFQYTTNREGAAASLGEGVTPLYDPKDVHLTMRAVAPVFGRWIERLFADQPEQVLRAKLAQERLGSQLALILSEAYSDAREAHLGEVRDNLRHALEISERLGSIGQAMVRSLDSEPVLDLALHTAAQLLTADGAAIWLPDRKGKTLRVHRMVGGDPSDRERLSGVGESLSGLTYQNNRPVKSVRSLPEEHRERVAAALRQRGIEAVLLVPLRAAGKAIGVLGVNCRVRRRFSPRDEHVLQTLADYVAIALENSRVHRVVRDALLETERLSHAKSEFVASVSHEIRSPISAFVGYVQILREGAFGPVTAEQCDTLDRLESIAESTLQLTSDLLDHTRADAGALPVRRATVPLAPLFDELGQTVRVQLAGRPIQFEARLAPEIESAWADPIRLRQILSNLLVNAAKFTAAGRIELSAGHSADGRAIEFVVSDTGIGIGARDRQHVFDLFYRADHHSGVSGAGIGLALSRQLAQLMDGDLEVQSELGKGTRFVLSLPVGG
jgi:signal transduction histidine kinase